MLVVYAIVGRSPKRPRRRGAAGETIRIVACGAVGVAVGEVDRAPAVTAAALTAHDAAVKRLAGDAAAILPARFGTVVADEGELRSRVAPLGRALREALDVVRGREQMTLRLFGGGGGAGGGSGSFTFTSTFAFAGSGTGTGVGVEYLERARRRMQVPELGPVRDAVARFVRAERVERATTPPLIATAYHLIDRGDARAYVAAARRAAAAAKLRVRTSGPFPPYAFAPEVAA